jgi:hypothetical protein
MSIPFVLVFWHFELNSVSITVPGIPYEYPTSIPCAMVLEILLNHVSCNNDFALGTNLAPSNDAFRNRPTRIYRRAMHHDIGPQQILQINFVDMLLSASTFYLYNFRHIFPIISDDLLFVVTVFCPARGGQASVICLPSSARCPLPSATQAHPGRFFLARPY